MSTKKLENQEFIEELILRELSYYDNIEQEILITLVLKRYEELKGVELKKEVIFDCMSSLGKKGDMEIHIPPKDIKEKEDKEIDKYFPAGSRMANIWDESFVGITSFYQPISILYKITEKGFNRLLKKDEIEKKEAKEALKKVEMKSQNLD